MKKCVIFIFLFFLSFTTYTQSSIEIGPAMYLNRSDQFHHYVGTEHMNLYYLGFNPYLKYSYANKNSYVYSAELAVYDIGTYFDISILPINNLPELDPIVVLRDQVIDIGFQVGYKLNENNDNLTFIPFIGINAFIPNFYRDNGTPKYIHDNVIVDNIEGGHFNILNYHILRNGSPYVAFGYTFGLNFDYKIKKSLSLTFGLDIKGSFMTLVKYELDYAFVESIEDTPDPNNATSGALTNDNARYGVRVGVKYTFR